jgi:hypothetical protein
VESSKDGPGFITHPRARPLVLKSLNFRVEFLNYDVLRFLLQVFTDLLGLSDIPGESHENQTKISRYHFASYCTICPQLPF